MNPNKEIDYALEAHIGWVEKLSTAIESGRCDTTPEKLKDDANCSFGKWLHYGIGAPLKSMPQYNSIKNLHADFHKEAAKILKSALEGNKDEAVKAMKEGSAFSKASQKLTAELTSWSKNLQ